MATHVTSFGTGHEFVGRDIRASAFRYMVPLGRLLFAMIFILSVPSHFSATGIAYAEQHGVPAATVAVPAAGILALIGGLSVALGYAGRFGAWLLIVFLIPVTLWMHAFWRETDPLLMQTQMVHFMKNLALIGGALLITYFGSGPVSVDEARTGNVDDDDDDGNRFARRDALRGDLRENLRDLPAETQRDYPREYPGVGTRGTSREYIGEALPEALPDEPLPDDPRNDPRRY